jgi:hypothetical protein
LCLRQSFWDIEDWRPSEMEAWSELIDPLYKGLDQIVHAYLRTELAAMAERFATEHPNAARARRESVPA